MIETCLGADSKDSNAGSAVNMLSKRQPKRFGLEMWQCPTPWTIPTADPNGLCRRTLFGYKPCVNRLVALQRSDCSNAKENNAAQSPLFGYLNVNCINVWKMKRLWNGTVPSHCVITRKAVNEVLIDVNCWLSCRKGHADNHAARTLLKASQVKRMKFTVRLCSPKTPWKCVCNTHTHTHLKLCI